jgi:hypothetical protein
MTYFLGVWRKEEAAIRPKSFKILNILFRIAASSFPLFPLSHCHPERIHPFHLQEFKRPGWMSEGSPRFKQNTENNIGRKKCDERLAFFKEGIFFFQR